MTIGAITTNSKSDGKGNWADGWNPNSDGFYFVDQTGKMSTSYYNVPVWQIEEDENWEGCESGWYITGDDDYICQNDIAQLPLGEGFVIKSSSAAEGKNPTIIFNGQVKKEPKDVPVTKFIMCGNCSPKPIKLGAITTNSESDGKANWTNGWNPSSDGLYFVDETGKMSASYYNVPVWQIEEDENWEGCESGWYITGDDDYICQNNLITIDPGTGFVIKSSSYAEGKEPTIIIPSALEK